MDRLIVDGAPTAPVDVSEGTFFKRRNSDAIWEINIGYACFVTVDTYVRQACAKNADGFSSFLPYFVSLGMIRRQTLIHGSLVLKLCQNTKPVLQSPCQEDNLRSTSMPCNELSSTV